MLASLPTVSTLPTAIHCSRSGPDSTPGLVLLRSRHAIMTMASVTESRGALPGSWEARKTLPYMIKDDASPTADFRSAAERYPSPASTTSPAASHGTLSMSKLDGHGSLAESVETGTTKATAGGRCPSRYDWSKHMAAIKRLYIEEDRPLKEVMSVMQREHNFVATARMYKIRLKKWGFTKNVSVKSEEIEPLLRVLSEAGGHASTEAPSSEVRLATGRVVGLDRLAAHLKRKTQRLSPTDPRRPQQLSLAHYHRDRSPSPKSLAINPPDIFRISELVFANIHAYVCGRIIEPGQPSCVSVPPAVTRDTISPVFHLVHAARDFFRGDRIDEGLALLRLAPKRIKDLIEAEPPDSLHCIFMTIVHLLTISGEERLVKTVRALVGLTAAMADERPTAWSPQYPMSRILHCMADLSSSEDFALRDMAIHAWKCLLRSHDLALGAPACGANFPMWLDMGESGGFDVLPSELLERTHTEIYRKNVEKYGEAHKAAWEQLYWLSELERQRVLARGLPTDRLQELLEKVLDILDRVPVTQGRRAKYNCEGHLAKIYKQTGEFASAERLMRAAIQTSLERNKGDCSITLTYVIELEKWLVGWGEDTKAEELRRWQAAVLVDLDESLGEQVT